MVVTGATLLLHDQVTKRESMLFSNQYVGVSYNSWAQVFNDDLVWSTIPAALHFLVFVLLVLCESFF